MPRVPLVALNAEKLNSLGLELGMLRRDIAAAAQVSESSVRLAFAGRPVGIGTASAIAKALKKPLKSILSDGPARCAGAA